MQTIPEGISSQAKAGWERPLDMSVHSLETPQLSAETEGRRTRRGRMWMIVVWLICAAPVIGSYLTFYVFRPDSHRSYGELIDPQRALPDVVAIDLNDKPINLKSLSGQWLLISVSGGACDRSCEQRLYLQRQLRESFGKEKDRVDWIWMVSDEGSIAPELRPALATATVLRVPKAKLDTWLFPAAGHELNDHLYLVDPLGHWMMRFPAELDIKTASAAKRDMDRLLRASSSWDKAGK